MEVEAQVEVEGEVEVGAEVEAGTCFMKCLTCGFPSVTFCDIISPASHVHPRVSTRRKRH